MNLPKTILVATDFSQPADEALDYAISLADKIGASITVLHAYDVPSMGVPTGALLTSTDVAGQLRTSAQAALEAAVAKRKKGGVQMATLLKMGDARESIPAVAHDIAADLIVMGTHGRRGIARALLGSVAETVVRTASCPVLTIRAVTSGSAAAKP